jgi:glyoxylase-like metal-dependent hydrolase (beta-lactamase superfamily II)
MVAHYNIGRLRIDVVSDGHFLQDAGGIFGLVPRVMWEPLAGAPDANNHIRIHLNCLLIRGDGNTVLVDTGVGAKIDQRRRETVYPGDYGYLLDNLARLGVHPADIDVVVNSHLHFDHCGWNTASVHGAAIPTFPNARYFIQRGEWDDAMHPNERTCTTYLADNFQPLQEGGRLELVDGEHQITAAVRFLPAPGHTDAHAAVVIADAGERAVYIGDMVQHILQLERTAWISAFDVLPLVSMDTKKRIVREALTSGALLLSPHFPYPGAGRLRDADGRTRFEAADPDPA